MDKKKEGRRNNKTHFYNDEHEERIQFMIQKEEKKIMCEQEKLPCFVSVSSEEKSQ